jgi:hypothetical protein
LFKGRTALLIMALACAAAPCAAQDIDENTGEAAGETAGPNSGAFPESLLFAWLKDDDGEDPAFLAVIDSDPASDTYGELLTTATTGMALSDAHHTPHSLPSSGRMFANAFRDGRTFIFDTSVPWLPRLRSGFERIGDYSFPHSFVELPGGNFLVTFQTSGEANDSPGGILELNMDGELVRAASAADPAASEFIRPYSLEVFSELDRIVSSSADMWGTQATEEVQLWRLSDLSLLDTIALPEGERRNVHQIPLEIRTLADGDSAYVVTWNCGLYRLSGIDGTGLDARLVWDFNSKACAIPLRLGDYWIQAIGEAWQIVVLDITDPGTPQLATVLQFPEPFQPHWIAAEPGGDRIVVTGYQAMSDRIVMLHLDPAEQNLSVDESFGDADDELPGFSTDREFWPHGRTGPATAHGVVFWPAEGSLRGTYNSEPQN